MTELIKSDKIIRQIGAVGNSKSADALMEKMLKIVGEMQGGVEDMVKSTVQENYMVSQGKTNEQMAKLVDLMGKLVEREMPVPIVNVATPQTVQPSRSGMVTLKGSITKRDQDGFMEDFEIEIKG